ncbi:MAG TPA: response regulator [Gemmatimonadaceae bacterium]|nr:response regulator [Gemmatimonadaceae bacterium]
MSLAILVVDDSAVMRAMIRRTLALGSVPAARIGEAAHGRQALEMLAAEPWDLVIADINMPVMNGEEMIERIRAHPLTAELPVVVVSTESSEARIEALCRFDVAFVHKPFTPAALAGAILRLIGVTDGHLPAASVDVGGDFDF